MKQPDLRDLLLPIRNNTYYLSQNFVIKKTFTIKSDVVTIPSGPDTNEGSKVTDYAAISGIDTYNSLDYNYQAPIVAKSADTEGTIFIYTRAGASYRVKPTFYNMGITPIISVDINKLLQTNVNLRLGTGKYHDGIYGQYNTISLGEFPQTFVGTEMQSKLENLYNVGKLLCTGKTYIGSDINNPNIEVELGGEKYVRTKRGVDGKGSPIVGRLSDNSHISDYNTDYFWCKVEPIRWRIMDNRALKAINSGENTNLPLELCTEKAIISGVPFFISSREDVQYSNLWQNSAIRAYLNGTIVNKKGESTGDENYFAPDGIVDFRYQSNFLSEAFNDIILKRNITMGINKRPSNPYSFQFYEMDNDQLLQAYVASGTSVFLHGPSGVGKSERVKQIDPTATRITLRPQMNPEEIDGTLDRTTGDYIQPLWYKQLCEKCKAEPDRQHVLFIDELTNVKPTVQSLVYSIVLDHAGKDGLWPLPDNSVVVAAGNESADNLAAYPMTNALYRRFCHITYEVDKQDWLAWAIGNSKIAPTNTIKVDKAEDRQKIHPSIIAYMMARKKNVLYQELDEENPGIVVDPRKWEIASNVLYATHNPNALVPAIGEDLTADFTDFVSQIMLSVDDVVNGRYNAADFGSLNMSEKLATMAGLMGAKENELGAVRQFIQKNLGKEMLANYDLIWSQNDPERALIIEENNKGTFIRKPYFPKGNNSNGDTSWADKFYDNPDKKQTLRKFGVKNKANNNQLQGGNISLSTEADNLETIDDIGYWSRFGR